MTTGPSHRPRRVAGLLLAAGGSTRLGRPKQLLADTHGVPAVVRMARALHAAGCAPVVVVTGAHAEAVAEALHAEAVTMVHHAGWAAGMGSTIARGIQALDALRSQLSGALIAPCDMPSVDAAHLEALIAAHGDGKRVASQYHSDDVGLVAGIPAIIPVNDWEWLARLQGDRGARPLFQTDTLTVFLRGGSFDLDTPADVARWRAHEPEPAAISTIPPEDLPMSTLAATALMDLEQEFANTRRLLERLPSDRLDFTPHAKSWPLGKLATHLLDPPFWGEVTCTTTTLAFDQPMPAKAVPECAEDFVRLWDERVAAFRPILAAMTDEDLQVTWQATMGGQPIMSMPRIAVLRTLVINHMIHHRAQLTMYYRLLDVPVPGLYGPSADEK